MAAAGDPDIDGALFAVPALTLLVLASEPPGSELDRQPPATNTDKTTIGIRARSNVLKLFLSWPSFMVFLCGLAACERRGARVSV